LERKLNVGLGLASILTAWFSVFEHFQAFLFALFFQGNITTELTFLEYNLVNYVQYDDFGPKISFNMFLSSKSGNQVEYP
jgi:hypothetical protein